MIALYYFYERFCVLALFRLGIILYLVAFSLGGGAVYADIGSPRDGAYLGMEPMPGFGDSDEKWYHEVRLTIRDSEVLMKASPVFFKNGVKTASASDGGFWTYKGKVVIVKQKFLLELHLADSDYVHIKNKNPVWPLVSSPDGTLTINGIKFEPARVASEKKDSKSQ